MTIIEARKRAFRLDASDFALLVAVYLISQVSELAAAFVIIGLAIRVYSRIRDAARIPCPRCGEPFGSDWEYPLGVGSTHCQNCDLPLHDT